MDKIDVLDKGFVQLIDHMGTDLSVVDAARVSFDKVSKWEYRCRDCDARFAFCVCSDSRYLSDKDTKLIKYLAKHKLTRPYVVGKMARFLNDKVPGITVPEEE